MRVRVADIPLPWTAADLPYLYVAGESDPRRLFPGEEVDLGEGSRGSDVVRRLLARGVLVVVVESEAATVEVEPALEPLPETGPIKAWTTKEWKLKKRAESDRVMQERIAAASKKIVRDK